MPERDRWGLDGQASPHGHGSGRSVAGDARHEIEVGVVAGEFGEPVGLHRGENQTVIREQPELFRPSVNTRTLSERPIPRSLDIAGVDRYFAAADAEDPAVGGARPEGLILDWWFELAPTDRSRCPRSSKLGLGLAKSVRTYRSSGMRRKKPRRRSGVKTAALQGAKKSRDVVSCAAKVARVSY